MTTLTLRYIKGHFVVTGLDIEATRFKTRREAKAWCGALPRLAQQRDRSDLQPPGAERRAVTPAIASGSGSLTLRAHTLWERRRRVKPE
jgi:hypothetical protein